MLKADFKACVELRDCSETELHEPCDEFHGLFSSVPDLYIPWESTERHIESDGMPENPSVEAERARVRYSQLLPNRTSELCPVVSGRMGIGCVVVP